MQRVMGDDVLLEYTKGCYGLPDLVMLLSQHSAYW
jgi:hypothetical protein